MYHVVSWCYEFHGCFREFWSLVPIPSLSVGIQMREVRGRYIIEHTADVASPSTTVVGPRHVGIDVGATSFAADNAGLKGGGGEVYQYIIIMWMG